jgi:hypothetical protein
MKKRFFRLTLAVCLAVILLIGALGVWPARSAVPHLAYGFNLYADVQSMLNMGFDWLKGFPGSNLAGFPPQTNILFRFSAKASDLADVNDFGQDIYLTVLDNKDYIDAYEIGNEVNIDNPDYGWAHRPTQPITKTLLCEAYARIKQADPGAIIMSAGWRPLARAEHGMVTSPQWPISRRS